MTAGYDETTEHEERTEYDQLLEALEGPARPSSPEMVLLASWLTHSLGDPAAVARIRVVVEGQESVRSRWLNLWHSMRPGQTPERDIAEETARAASQVVERQQALTALARAALERLRDESAQGLADLLERSVDELAEQVHHAGQVEGDREPYDPQEILEILPERYHQWFMADYRRALRLAYPPAGFLALQRLLKQWRARAEHYADPSHPASLEEARQSDSRPWSEVREELRAQGRLG